MNESPEVRFNGLAHCLGLGSLQFRFYLACCRCPRGEDQNQLLEQDITLFFLEFHTHTLAPRYALREMAKGKA